MLEKIVLKGTPLEIGRAHGEALKYEIKDAFDFYLQLWKMSASQAHAKIVSFSRAVSKYLPHLALEIEGISEGCGLPKESIYAINSRTELLAGFGIAECTSIGISSSAMYDEQTTIAQNWDWMRYFRDRTRVVEIIQRDKPSVMTLIEPGMVGKIGMNSDGLGLCINFLTFKEARDGIPVHIMTRAILECGSTAQAQERITAFPRASNANYLVGDSADDIVSIETTADSAHPIKRKPFVTHTNSYNALGEVCSRQKLFDDYISHACKSTETQSARTLTLESLKNAFQLYGVEAQCTDKLDDVETLHTIILQLNEKRMLISEGARSNLYTPFTFS